MAIANTINTGAVDTERVASDEKQVDMVEEFQLLDPGQTQFTTMLGDSRLKSKPATASQIKWLEDQYFPRQSSVAGGGYLIGATSVTVAAGEGPYFKPNDLVRNAARGDMFKVQSVAGDVLTVQRSIGSVAAVAGTAGDQLMIVGNAAPQFADVGTLKTTQRVLGYNYLQTQRDPAGASDEEENISTFGNGHLSGEMAKKAVEHKRAIESNIWFGARSFTSASPNSVGTSGGAIEYISTNRFPSIGTLDKTVWETNTAQVLGHGNIDQKVIFCSPKVGQALSGFLRDNWVKATPTDTVWGVKVNAYVSGTYGVNIPVVVKQEWGTFSTSLNQYGGIAFIIDMGYVRFRPQLNRNTALLQNRQSPGVDGRIDEWRTRYSLMFAVEQAHGYFSGITG